MRMKKLFVLFIAFVLALGGYAIPSDKYQLLVNTTNGKMTFSLSNVPEISFTTTDVVINVNEVVTTISKADLLDFVFEKADVPSSLQSMTNSAINYHWLSNGDVELTNFGSIDIVNVYTIAGQLLTTQMGVGSSIIPLSQMPSGVYIVSVNYGQTLKITKP